MSSSTQMRIRIPSASSAPTSRGRSLEEVNNQFKKEHSQRRGNYGGRGRGRGGFRRRNNRNREPEKKPEPKIPQLKPGQPGYFPVGGAEWAKRRKAVELQALAINHELFFGDMTNEEIANYQKCLPSIPKRSVPRRNEKSPQELAESDGWELNFEDSTNTYYWTHPKYSNMGNLWSSHPNKKETSESPRYIAGYVNLYGERYMIPIAGDNEDPLGLAYTFNISGGGSYKTITANEWRSYWDSRTGRRREKYLWYLEQREKKKAEHMKAGLNTSPNFQHSSL